MPDGIAARLNGVPEDAADARAVDSVYLHAGGPVVARPGRRPGPGLTVTVGGSPEAATVTPGGGIITDSTGGGSYRFVLDASVSKNIATRPGSGTSRIDLMIARIRNTDVHITDGALDVIVELVAGTPGASPSPPAVPAAALQLASLTVPASGTITVTGPPPRIAAAGGTVIVANAGERDAISPIWDGIKVYREDTDSFESRINGAWAVDAAAGDTGWSNLSGWASFWTPPAGDTPRVRIANGRVSLQGALKRLSAAAGGGGAVSPTGANLAAAYRPTKDVYKPVVVWANPDPLIYALIETNGDFSLRNMGSGPLAINDRVDICIDWPVG